MGADAPMLRSRSKPGRCPVEGHDHTCEMAGERPQRERHDEVLEVGRDMIEQWSTSLDVIAGICPLCRHPFDAARPDGGDGVYRWCGVTGCRCAPPRARRGERMSDHLFRDGEVLHLAEPDRDEDIAWGALSAVRTYVALRSTPTSTRCDLEIRGMDELAPESVRFTVREPRMLRNDCGVDVLDPAGVSMCAECVMDSRCSHRDRAAREADRTWTVGAVIR